MKKMLIPAMIFLFIALGCSTSVLPSVPTEPPVTTPNTPSPEVSTLTSAPATPDGSVPAVPTLTPDPAPLIPVEPESVFVQVASAENISFNYTYINSPLTNNNPDAIMLVTSNWNPGGDGGTYNDHPIGVWYDISTLQWAIYNQDFADMPTDAAFNVFIPPTGTTTFVQTATSENIVSNWTYIDSPLTNSNPGAIIIVTSNWNPGNVGGIYNDHSIGVWYDTSTQKWAIYNQDIAAMPIGAAFNVLIASGATAFIQIATVGNTVSNWTYFDSPLTNNSPDAIVLVTSNWNPVGFGGTYNDHETGVWYDTGTQQWAVYNQDIIAMPIDAAFNIMVLGNTH